MKGSGRCLSDVAAAVCGLLLFMEATDSISTDNRFCLYDMDVDELDLTRKYNFEGNGYSSLR